MNFLEVFWIAVGLSMDAFAVSIACSVLLCHVSFRHIFRLGFHFGLFQAVMPVIGWIAGRSVSEYISAWDHWVAFGLLSVIGLKALKESFSDDDGENSVKGDPTKGLSLILLSVATSIDALAVGVSLAAVNVSIFQPALLIGIITACFSVVGTVYGCRIGARFGKKVEAAGGIILIIIGFKILLEHLLS
ncbi:manganese efflux pump [Geovibrio thiophilus]|uniref:Putative manganese efflux pump MntP n=1 Tax=Geovibrio thiophilus TaxID=139438 RepID=A0A3R5UZE2_9BACT|nr:manganese efflux pump MntP family protein [Geovibrio thiophilus]QAR32020.1 manganese efflux pump [Geovibrio thiophilus]